MNLALDTQFQKALAEHNVGQSQEAARLYRIILANHPRHSDANHNLGVILANSGELDTALNHFKTAVEISPGNEQFWISYINFLSYAGKHDLAKAALKQGKGSGLGDGAFNQLTLLLSDRSDPKSGNLRESLNRLINLFKVGDLQKVLTFGTSLSTQFPKNMIILNVLGATYFKLKNMNSSFTCYRKAIMLKPDYADSYNNLGVTFLKLKRTSEAVRLFTKALIIKRNYPEASEVLAKVFEQTEQVPAAIKMRLEAVAFAPGKSYLYRELGKLLLKDGLQHASLVALKKAIVLSPENADSYYFLGNTMNYMSDLDPALVNYLKALKLAPNSPHFYNNLAGLLKKMGKDPQDLIPFFQKAVLVSPHYVNSYVNLGLTFIDLKKYSKSLEISNRATKVNVRSAEGFNALGISYRDCGQKDSSLNCFKKSIILDPLKPVVYNNYGVALCLVGSNGTAGALFEKALKLKPDFAEPYFNLGEIYKENENGQKAIIQYKYSIILSPDNDQFFTALGQLKDLEQRDNDAVFCYKAASILSKSATMADVFLGRIERNIGKLSVEKLNVFPKKLPSDNPHPLVETLFLPVDPDLVNALYDLPNLNPSLEKETTTHKHSAGIRNGNMRVSADYFFLDKPQLAIQAFKLQVTEILTSFVKRPIFISESFFNIYKSGSDTKPHNHLHKIDFDLQVSGQKFSLVYYVRSGDTLATEPGILKLYNPEYSIRPKDGDLIIFPANLEHSATYNGSIDRIIIGINFYQT